MVVGLYLYYIRVNYSLLIRSTQKFNLKVLVVILKDQNQELNFVKAIKSINLNFEEIIKYFHSKLRSLYFPIVVIVEASQHSFE